MVLLQLVLRTFCPGNLQSRKPMSKHMPNWTTAYFESSAKICLHLLMSKIQRRNEDKRDGERCSRSLNEESSLGVQCIAKGMQSSMLFLSRSYWDSGLWIGTVVKALMKLSLQCLYEKNLLKRWSLRLIKWGWCRSTKHQLITGWKHWNEKVVRKFSYPCIA